MRRLLLLLSIAALAWGALVLATGGIEWRIAGVLFRSRAPDRALLIGLVLLAVQAALFREAFTRDVARATASARPLLPFAALACAGALALHAVHFGAFTAGGSDSYGYVSQAYSWANRSLPRAEPLPITVPWPAGDSSLAPLGYRAGPDPHTIVPTYAPGLPLMMAAFLIFGSCGPYLVVPLFTALVVWLAFALGRRADGPWVGMMAALFVATSPIVQFQSTWAMSDVPAAALWTGAVYAALGPRRRDALLCGIWTAAGLLVRPNLPIVPAVLLFFLLATAHGRERWTRAALFALPAGIAVATIAALFTLWYGAPWNSGYGGASQIFLASNIVPNLKRYPVWLWDTQSPFILLTLLPLVPPFSREVDRRSVLLCTTLFAATLLSYLVYSPFDDWWYLRFLLPALPALFVLLAIGIVSAGRRLPPTWRQIPVIAVTIIIVTLTSRFSLHTLTPGGLRDSERRYADVGLFISQSLPRNAVVLAVQESGSAKHYGGRQTIRWDLIDRGWTARAVSELQSLGLHPYLVIEDFELPQFRDWFGIDATRLPWALVARMRQNGGVSVFDMSTPAGAVTPVSLEPGVASRCQGPAPVVLQQQ